jgi:predicted RNase H-like nuclease
MESRKKSKPGREEREALMEPRYGRDYRLAQSTLPHGQHKNDDLLDAFAALWAAERINAGEAVCLPHDPPVDAAGLRMEIVV